MTRVEKCILEEALHLHVLVIILVFDFGWHHRKNGLHEQVAILVGLDGALTPLPVQGERADVAELLSTDDIEHDQEQMYLVYLDH